MEKYGVVVVFGAILGQFWGHFGAIWEDFGEIVGRWVRLRRVYLCCARYDIMYFRGGVSKIYVRMAQRMREEGLKNET